MGQDSTYQEAVKTHADAIYRFLYHCSNDEVLSEDITSDTFKQFFIEESKIKNIRLWLFEKAYDLFSKDIRKKNTIIAHMGARPANQEILHATLLEIEEQKKHAIEQLSHLEKSILLLHDFERFQSTEISKIVNLTEEQVKETHFKARKKIKDVIKPLIDLAS